MIMNMMVMTLRKMILSKLLNQPKYPYPQTSIRKILIDACKTNKLMNQRLYLVRVVVVIVTPSSERSQSVTTRTLSMLKTRFKVQRWCLK